MHIAGFRGNGWRLWLKRAAEFLPTVTYSVLAEVPSLLFVVGVTRDYLAEGKCEISRPSDMMSLLLTAVTMFLLCRAMGRSVLRELVDPDRAIWGETPKLSANEFEDLLCQLERMTEEQAHVVLVEGRRVLQERETESKLITHRE